MPRVHCDASDLRRRTRAGALKREKKDASFTKKKDVLAPRDKNTSLSENKSAFSQEGRGRHKESCRVETQGRRLSRLLVTEKKKKNNNNNKKQPTQYLFVSGAISLGLVMAVKNGLQSHSLFVSFGFVCVFVKHMCAPSKNKTTRSVAD